MFACPLPWSLLSNGMDSMPFLSAGALLVDSVELGVLILVKGEADRPEIIFLSLYESIWRVELVCWSVTGRCSGSRYMEISKRVEVVTSGEFYVCGFDALRLDCDVVLRT